MSRLTQRKPRPLARDGKGFRDDRLFIVACDDTYAPKQYFAFFKFTRLHVHVINVPDGPAMLVQMPGGENILLNGGSSASRLSSELGQWLPFFERRLDAVLVTAVKSKPLAGLPDSLERYPAQMVLWNPQAASLRNGELLAEVLDQQNVTPIWLETGQTLSASDGAKIRVLAQDASATALLIEWDCFSMLIPGGFSAEDMARLEEANGLGADVILLSEADLAHTSAKEWGEFQPVLVMWSGTNTAEAPLNDQRWVHINKLNYVEVITDGQEMWANVDQ